MKCKYCQAELGSNSSVCPSCGKDNLKDDLKALKIVALVLVCVVMLVLLAGLVCYGVTGSFVPDWFGGSDSTGDTSGANTTYDVITASGTVTMTAEDLESCMDAVVATMGDHTMTNRDMQMYYWLAAYTYGDDADLTADLTTQIYDEETGKSYHDYFIEEAMKIWQEMILMEQTAKDAGYELPEDYVSELEGMESYLAYMGYYYYGVSSADEVIKVMYGPGCDYATYYSYANAYYMGGLYWADMMLELEVTEEEINTYFEENEESLANDYDISITKDSGNLVDIRNIMICVDTVELENEDGTTSTVEDWDSCLEAIQAVYDLYKAGEMTEECFIALVAEYSEDENSNANEGLYEGLYQGSMMEVDVRHILIMPEEDTEESWAAALTSTEEILNQWLAGDMSEDSFAELANEYSDDNDGNVTNGGIYTDIYLGQMVEEFEDWCFNDSRQVGDYDIVKTTYGYHIMYFVHSDRAADDWVFAEERTAGDVELVKVDGGYMLLYFSDAEPAWYSYSKYGAQAEKAEAILDELIENNPYTVEHDSVVIGVVE